MDNNSNTWGWVIGIIVVILVILGIWWYVSGTSNTTTNINTGGTVPTGTTQNPGPAGTGPADTGATTNVNTSATASTTGI